MRAKPLIEAIRRSWEERSSSTVPPLAKRRDAIAYLLYGSYFGAVCAADAAGSLGPPKVCPERVVEVGRKYRVHTTPLVLAACPLVPRVLGPGAPVLHLESLADAFVFLAKHGMRRKLRDAVEPFAANDWEAEHARSVAAAVHVAYTIAQAIPSVERREDLRIMVTARAGILDVDAGVYMGLIKLLLGVERDIALHLHVDTFEGPWLQERSALLFDVPRVHGVDLHISGSSNVVKSWQKMVGPAADLHVIYSEGVGYRPLSYLFTPVPDRSFRLSRLAGVTLLAAGGRVAGPLTQHAIALGSIRGERTVVSPGLQCETFLIPDKPFPRDSRRPDYDEHRALEAVECLDQVIEFDGGYPDSVWTPLPGREDGVLLVRYSNGALSVHTDGTVLSDVGGSVTTVTLPPEERSSLEEFLKQKDTALSWDALAWITRTFRASLTTAEPDPELEKV